MQETLDEGRPRYWHAGTGFDKTGFREVFSINHNWMVGRNPKRTRLQEGEQERLDLTWLPAGYVFLYVV